MKEDNLIEKSKKEENEQLKGQSNQCLVTTSNNDKIPEINNNISKDNNNNNLFPSSSFTPKFNRIYNKYIDSQKRVVYPNIRTLLNNFQKVKIKNLNQKEAVHAEIGEEIKKNRIISELIKGKSNTKLEQTFTKENMSTRSKENRIYVLESFRNFANEGKLTLRKKWKNINNIEMLDSMTPRIFYQKKTNYNNNRNNKSSINYIKKEKLMDLLESKENMIKKSNVKLSTKLKNIWKYEHKRLNLLCDSINDDTEKTKNLGKMSINRFNYNWNRYRKLEEFRYPITQREFNTTNY